MPRDRERKKKRTKSGGYRVDDLSKSDKGYHTYDSGDTDETYLPTGMLRFSYCKIQSTMLYQLGISAG